MSTHDYIARLSPYSDSNHAHGSGQFEEADLRLSLSLPVADLYNNERNLEEYPRALDEESQASFGNPESREDENQRGIASANGLERVYSEAIYGHDERKAGCMRSFVLQGISEEAEDSSDYNNAFSSLNEAVGWPPVQTCRKNIISKPLYLENQRAVEETMNGNIEECGRSSNFLKVIMDGMPIGRKVDLNAYNSYNSLALALEHIFQPSSLCKDAAKESSITNDSKGSWLLKASSRYILTYQDKHGNWMFVGDAPWQVFVKSVKRLRIAKG